MGGWEGGGGGRMGGWEGGRVVMGRGTLQIRRIVRSSRPVAIQVLI